MNDDERQGMDWWNGLTEVARGYWLRRAGVNSSAADAWAAFKAEAEADRDREPPPVPLEWRQEELRREKARMQREMLALDDDAAEDGVRDRALRDIFSVEREIERLDDDEPPQQAPRG